MLGKFASGYTGFERGLCKPGRRVLNQPYTVSQLVDGAKITRYSCQKDEPLSLAGRSGGLVPLAPIAAFTHQHHSGSELSVSAQTTCTASPDISANPSTSRPSLSHLVCPHLPVRTRHCPALCIGIRLVYSSVPTPAVPSAALRPAHCP